MSGELKDPFEVWEEDLGGKEGVKAGSIEGQLHRLHLSSVLLPFSFLLGRSRSSPERPSEG